MEIRLSLALLALLGVIAFGLTSRAPQAVFEADSGLASELAELEDAFAQHHDDLALARRLSATYLKLGEPGLAVGVVRAVSPELVADPILTHRLAQAYEAFGRVHDALATAAVARSRCLRAIGSSEASPISAPPRFACNAAALIELDRHEQALAEMARLGVTDPKRDPRAGRAHDKAARTARVASLDHEL